MASTQDHESFADEGQDLRDGQGAREHAGPETDLVRDTDPGHHAYDASSDPTRQLGAERDLVAGGESAPVMGADDRMLGAERDLVAGGHDVDGDRTVDPDREIGAERDLVADADRTVDLDDDLDR